MNIELLREDEQDWLDTTRPTSQSILFRRLETACQRLIEEREMFHKYSIRAGEEYSKIVARLAKMHDVLREAHGFIDRHSEAWYTPGQELLALIDKELE